jgi:hypothetical protein
MNPECNLLSCPEIEAFIVGYAAMYSGHHSAAGFFVADVNCKPAGLKDYVGGIAYSLT